jgi:hypothetical protein
MAEYHLVFLAKAEESLAGAESEFATGGTIIVPIVVITPVFKQLSPP